MSTGVLAFNNVVSIVCAAIFGVEPAKQHESEGVTSGSPPEIALMVSASA